jgi:uncharacterized protein (TIGR02996 family)
MAKPNRNAVPLDATGRGLLQQIRERPEEDTSRLAFADWPEERGDPRGELLRSASAGDSRKRRSGSHRRRLVGRVHAGLSAGRAKRPGGVSEVVPRLPCGTFGAELMQPPILANLVRCQRAVLARLGLIDRRAQAKVRSARRTDTPTQSVWIVGECCGQIAGDRNRLRRKGLQKQEITAC